MVGADSLTQFSAPTVFAPVQWLTFAPESVGDPAWISKVAARRRSFHQHRGHQKTFRGQSGGSFSRTRYSGVRKRCYDKKLVSDHEIKHNLNRNRSTDRCIAPHAPVDKAARGVRSTACSSTLGGILSFTAHSMKLGLTTVHPLW